VLARRRKFGFNFPFFLDLTKRWCLKALSGHPDRVGECLLSGVKRTSRVQVVMSAFELSVQSFHRERGKRYRAGKSRIAF